jgi:ATP-dependent Clp protease adaptor protein ClpS|tara:strand:+ start:352 stop:657 length:306 start_codon:yes stop_codon:yes gene_type:complete
MSEKTEVKQSTKSKTSIKPPNLYNVIYLNDNKTTVEFVVESLKVIFHHSEEIAKELTVKIHNDGSSVVKTLTYEVAEQKGVEVTMLARNNGFPLEVKLQPA